LRSGNNSVEAAKARRGGDGLRIREDLPGIIERGHEAMTMAEKDLLKWVGVFFRRPTPGRFMMRVRMPNGFSSSEQLRTIAELSRRLGNSVIDITTRQQVELRGFTIASVPRIWEKLRGVNLHSLQTGMDNVRNINGCALAGLTPYELVDASPIVLELDRRMVGADGNPEFTNLPRKLNITVTGCLENCTHSESQDIALVPAIADGRLRFNVLVGGKMGSGGFTPASSLNVFVEPDDAVEVVLELVGIYRDHGPREARAKCRLAFLIAEWGLLRLRAELVSRLGSDPGPAGTDVRQSRHSDHLGITSQQQRLRVAAGLSVPMGRVDPGQLTEIARLAGEYGDGSVRFTTAQNVIIPNVAKERLEELQQEPLLEEFTTAPSPFVRGLVACVGTDFCNLAQIETKQRALELSQALEQRLSREHGALRIHWSGCPAGCGNHQAADIGLRGLRANASGRIIEAVAIYAGGKTGPHAVAGTEVLAAVPCDASLPDVVANVIRASQQGLGAFSAQDPISEVSAVAEASVAISKPTLPSVRLTEDATG
jgi:ferredoxin-nitrite reductase